MSATPAPAAGLRIGVSACLLGDEVRFDGGHKLDHFLVDTLGRFVEFVPVCPEVGVGLGVPRETLRLVEIAGATRLLGNKTGSDITERMQRFSARKVRELEALDLSGYVLKKDSPSCGFERVRLYRAETGIPTRSAVGLFAAALMSALPLLPVEEEGRLRDHRLRENFIERIFSYRRLRDLLAGRWTMGALVAFHSRAKLQVLAHDPAAYRELGQLVAGGKALPRQELAERYAALYLGALARPATVKRHVNVLQHMAGYFKKQLDAAAREELHGLIADFAGGLAPLIVPLTLLRHYSRAHQVEYLVGQFYLEPSPKELLLRNHV
jgi:uncharacterized protein YbgA (DUF1722 family)/uncharacterized protein YbbK (DUF523 family)